MCLQVIPQVDGLICYMDATCHCEARRGGGPGGGSVGGHTLDMLELEAMMRTIPAKLSPPVLVLLARMDDPQVLVTDSDHDAESCLDHSGHRRCQQGEASMGSPPPRHQPAMLCNVLSKLDLPWAVSSGGGDGIYIQDNTFTPPPAQVQNIAIIIRDNGKLICNITTFT